MTITVILRTATIETTEDGSLGTHVLVRRHIGAAAEPLNTCDTFRKRVEQLSALDDEALIAELGTLSRTMRTSSPEHWAIWFLVFLDSPAFLVRLHLRAGEQHAGRDPHGAKIGRALRKASTAVGWGNRGRGRAPKKKAA